MKNFKEKQEEKKKRKRQVYQQQFGWILIISAQLHYFLCQDCFRCERVQKTFVLHLPAKTRFAWFLTDNWYYWLNNLVALHRWKWQLMTFKSIRVKFLNFCIGLSMLVQNLYSYYKLMFPKESWFWIIFFSFLRFQILYSIRLNFNCCRNYVISGELATL